MTRPHLRSEPDERGFGCRRCYGDDASRAWTYYEDGLVVERELVGEPHFIVQLRRCAACGQQFVWVFTEADGEDAQRRYIVPVSDGEPHGVESLDRLGEDRRYLRTDWPTGAGKPTVEWATGRFPLPGTRLR